MSEFSGQLAHGTVQSSRERVNVMIPGRGGDGMGNNYFRPARGNVGEYVRKCVTDAIADLAELYPNGWAARPYTLYVRPDHAVRGAYHFGVWAPETSE